MNVSDKDFDFSPDNVLGGLDAGSLGYSKMDHKVSQQNLTNLKLKSIMWVVQWIQ